jgi:hypothetical protein
MALAMLGPRDKDVPTLPEGEMTALLPIVAPSGYTAVASEPLRGGGNMERQGSGGPWDVDRGVWYAGGGRDAGVQSADLMPGAVISQGPVVIQRRREQAEDGDGLFGAGGLSSDSRHSGWGWVQDDVAAADRAVSARREQRQEAQRRDPFRTVPGLPNTSPYRDAMPEIDPIFP